jgi:DNA-binding transcriptional LysR family regulator
MELTQLRYFLRVCSDLNMTVSASKLYITQQALSKSIRRLEDELGVRLFVRESKGLRMTEYGKYFRKAVRNSVSILDNACTHLRMESGQLRTLLRVGVINGCIDKLNRVCVMFTKENPYVDFEIFEQTDTMNQELLLDKKLDMALVTGPVDDKRFDSHLLFETPWCMLMPMGHSLSEKNSLKVADILPYPIIDGTDQHNGFREFRQYCSERGGTLQYSARTLDSITRIILCKNEEGISLFSLTGANAIVVTDSTFTCVPMEEDIKLKFYAIVPKDEHLSGEVQAFMEFVARNIDESWYQM